MVNPGIRQHCTGSSSSSSDGPNLTINQDITAVDVVSSNAFEGPEKLLEVWFASSEKALPMSISSLGLKAVSRGIWKDMLDVVNCKVLSVLESRNVDAYLLSESSMFVFPHKIILKTCGTTTLLYGLPRMLEIAALDAGLPHIKANLSAGTSAAAIPYRVFYSRKNFIFPTQQRGPHRSWHEEVKYLDKMFLGGSGYMIGKMNGEHWYLYITGPRTGLTPPTTTYEEVLRTPTRSVQLGQFGFASLTETDVHDETVEILMTDLDMIKAQQFYSGDASTIAMRDAHRTHLARKDAIEHLGVVEEYNASKANIFDNEPSYSTNKRHLEASARASDDCFGNASPNIPAGKESSTKGHTLGTVVTENCGLSDIYPKTIFPDARIDSYLFTPCGYSANGVVPVPGEAESAFYWTAHITPEPQCSYASFETNVPTYHSGHNTIDLVNQVVAIFDPGRFSVTMFEARDDQNNIYISKDGHLDFVKGYRCTDRIVHQFEGYGLVFLYFERNEGKGSALRLGEQSP